MLQTESIATPAIIQSARLSFLWAEVLPDFVQQKVSDNSPFTALTRSYLFRQLFEAARNGTATPKFEVPWIRDRKQHFWMRYLIQAKLSDVTGKQAWENLVPLRLGLGTSISADWLNSNTFIDSFYYPFGLALAITFRWEPNLALPDLISKAYDIRKNGKFVISGSPGQPLSLEGVADAVLGAMRKQALGETSKTGFRSQDPFSIVTIIQAKGVDPGVDIRDDPDTLRALEALTNWPSDYEYVTLPDRDKKVGLDTMGKPPLSSALYAGNRGRTLWFPALFRSDQNATPGVAIEQSRRSSKLACYHRNLLFASLEIESLGRLISYTAALLNECTRAIKLAPQHRAMTHNAAKQLAKLYLGQKGNTWRSASAQRQILQNCFKDMQKVLAEFKESPVPEAQTT